MSPLKVVVADDHTLVRQSVVRALAQADDVEVVAEAADGPGALAAVREHQPDLLMLDIAMPGVDGFATAEQVRRAAPDVRILFLSMHDDDASLRHALALDADGFVSKSAPVSELLEGVRRIGAGERFLSAALADRQLVLATDTDTSPPSLTGREREILGLLAQGHRPGEIASSLELSIKTVKNHLTAVYNKLGVETGAQAVAEAYRRGLAIRVS
ncbi:MAG TPA: response regulator transcription factor [Egicoccus sp.]|nr:response regulator transcription factor [Egicoccus sp.]HSK24945.1 response regulator transcription factor [Egicoccus sp.]